MFSNVWSLFDVSVTAAFSWVNGDATARTCFSAPDRSFPMWVQYDATMDDQGIVTFSARTNDIDLLIGSGPSLCVRGSSAGELHAEVVAYLMGAFATNDTVDAKVFLENGSSVNILNAKAVNGSTDRPELKEQPEFLSL